MAGEIVEYFIVYEKATGAIWMKSSGPPGAAQAAVARYTQDGDRAVIGMPYDAFAAISGAGIPAAEQLVPLKLAVKAGVDAQVGILRRRYITDIPGQSETYALKEQEARAYLAATNPADDDYRYLMVEAEATGTTVPLLAAEVVATADIWHAINQQLEGRRLGAAREIKDADTIPAIVAAAKIDWDALLNPVAPPVVVPAGEVPPQDGPPPPG